MFLKVGREEYNIEFTFEASLCGECTEKVISFMLSIPENGTKEEIKDFVASFGDIPMTTLTMFYAGLLENHGEDGDGTVLSKKDAKAILKRYLEENKDNESGNFYAVMEMLIDQMGNDGFFDRIGLTQIMSAKPEKQPKTPQDHKKKTTTTKKTSASVGEN